MKTFAVTGSIAGALVEWALVALDQPVRRRHRMRTARPDVDVRQTRRQARIPPVPHAVAGCAAAARGTLTMSPGWRNGARDLHGPITLRAPASAPANGTILLCTLQAARAEPAADPSVLPMQHALPEVLPWRRCARRFCGRAMRDLHGALRRMTDVILAPDCGLGAVPVFETDAIARVAIGATPSA